MALKLTVEKIDEIEEALRPLYVEKDGKFSLDVDGIEDTSGLKRTVAALRKQSGDLEKKVKAWEGLGKTADEIAELLLKADEEKTKEAETKGDWEKLKQQMNDRHMQEIKKKDDALAKEQTANKSLQSALQRHVIDSQLTTAIAAERGYPQLLLPLARPFVKMEEDGTVKVVDDKGGDRVNGKGDPMTVAELIAEMKTSDIYSRCFDGTGSSGSGSRPTSGSGAPSIKSKAEFKSEGERAAFVDKYGLPAYRALPDRPPA